MFTDDKDIACDQSTMMTTNKECAAIDVITIMSLSVTVSLQCETVLTSFTTNYTTHNTNTENYQ